MRARLSESLIVSLSLPQRLALAYAPGASKPAVLALFALDARLAEAIRQVSEPLMGQMRLAWWRDQLRLEPERRERSDELMGALDVFAGEEAALHEVVDGWEMLLSEQLVANSFAVARGEGFAALARVLGVPASAGSAARTGQRYALADLAAHLGSADEKQAVLALVEHGPRIALPRSLRSLAMLDGLARRSLARGGTPLLDGPGAMLAAIRLGLTGR